MGEWGVLRHRGAMYRMNNNYTLNHRNNLAIMTADTSTVIGFKSTVARIH